MPLLHEFRIIEYPSNNLGAVGGRIGVVGTNQSFQFAQDTGGFFLVFADDGQCTDTFAVKREGLGERARDEERNACIGKLTDGPASSSRPSPKPW